MDVKKFQDSRNAELDSFKKTFAFLKKEYSSALSAAIREPDPNQQQILIQRVQQINSQLANELNSVINVLNKGSKGFDPKELDELTNDLIQYQKDYDEIEKSKDKVNTLKLIHGTTADRLKNATYMYYIYIAILIILCLYISYLVFSTSLTHAFKTWFPIIRQAPT
jgi:hypothetical protein